MICCLWFLLAYKTAGEELHLGVIAGAQNLEDVLIGCRLASLIE
jgi:hypothetical protein